MLYFNAKFFHGERKIEFLGQSVNIFFSVAKEKAANTCDANTGAANMSDANMRASNMLCY
jgi:hypothetical protein